MTQLSVDGAGSESRLTTAPVKSEAGAAAVMLASKSTLRSLVKIILATWVPVVYDGAVEGVEEGYRASGVGEVGEPKRGGLSRVRGTGKRR